MVIRCGEREWKMHRLVLATHSAFFAKACSEEWEESRSGVITLKETDEAVVDTMIRFMYHLDYHTGSEQGGPDMVVFLVEGEKEAQAQKHYRCPECGTRFALSAMAAQRDPASDTQACPSCGTKRSHWGRYRVD